MHPIEDAEEVRKTGDFSTLKEYFKMFFVRSASNYALFRGLEIPKIYRCIVIGTETLHASAEPLHAQVPAQGKVLGDAGIHNKGFVYPG